MHQNRARNALDKYQRALRKDGSAETADASLEAIQKPKAAYCSAVRWFVWYVPGRILQARQNVKKTPEAVGGRPGVLNSRVSLWCGLWKPQPNYKPAVLIVASCSVVGRKAGESKTPESTILVSERAFPG